MTDWTIYNNLLPWCALTVEQMRAFEASEGEMIWLTSDGGWHPINPPVAPGWIIRVAELAIEDLIEEHEKRALAPQPEAAIGHVSSADGADEGIHQQAGQVITWEQHTPGGRIVARCGRISFGVVFPHPDGPAEWRMSINMLHPTEGRAKSVLAAKDALERAFLAWLDRAGLEFKGG